MILDNVNSALVLCPHTDDELGCAGSILFLLEKGIEVRYIALSRCEASVPEGLPHDILEQECRLCMKRLGVPDNNVEVWDFDVRHFPTNRQAILERFVVMARNYNPGLVLLPCSNDIHQDHATVYMEGLRAFKFSTLLGYEHPQNLLQSSSRVFIRLSTEMIEQKIFSLSAYESQLFRSYTEIEYIYGLAKVRGVQCNTKYAEAFEAIRIVI